MPALLSGVSASSKSGGDSYPSPFSLDPVFVRTGSVHGLVFQKMDLTHDVGINLVNSLVSWAQDRSFLKDLPEVTSQDYCHSSKWSMLCVLICESKKVGAFEEWRPNGMLP
ncbi:uncharacterized protein [Aegilops tauschii subsp. strangulata]|uniref:uncharacterized protein isoform X1 n=1 Tax=Aegilops tauschii subsp. strangulata TaxID=200361 RepID=UPI003CC846B2